jgi:DNA-binding transcriptional regulator GbsR (MarR family)
MSKEQKNQSARDAQRVELAILDNGPLSTERLSSLCNFPTEKVAELCAKLREERLLYPMVTDHWRSVTTEELAADLLRNLPATYNDLRALGRGHALFDRVFDRAFNSLIESGRATWVDSRLYPTPPGTSDDTVRDVRTLNALREHTYTQNSFGHLARAIGGSVADAGYSVARLIRTGNVQFEQGVYRVNPKPLAPELADDLVLGDLKLNNTNGLTVGALAESTGLRLTVVQASLQTLQDSGRARTYDGFRYLPCGPERERDVLLAVRKTLAMSRQGLRLSEIEDLAGFAPEEVDAAVLKLHGEGLIYADAAAGSYRMLDARQAADRVSGLHSMSLDELIASDGIGDTFWELTVLRGYSRAIAAVPAAHAPAPVVQPTRLIDYIESAKTVITRVRAILRGFNVSRDNELDDALDHLERLSENDIVETDVEDLRKEIEKHKEEISDLLDVIENAEYSFDEAGSGLRETMRKYKRSPRR